MERTFAVFALCIWVAGCANQELHSKPYTKTDRAQLYVSIANGSLAQKDPTSALQALNQAEKLDAHLPELHYCRGLAYFQKNDLSSAMASMRKALELSPKYSDAHNALGSFLIRAENSNEAIPHLMAAAQDPLYRDSYMSWTNLGIIKYRVGEYNQAKNFFDHAIEDAPKKACSAYYYRGQIYQLSERLKEAIEEYRQATKQFCVHFGEAEMALGLAYEKRQEYDLARKTFLEIRQQFPDTKIAEKAMEQLKFLP